MVNAKKLFLIGNAYVVVEKSEGGRYLTYEGLTRTTIFDHFKGASKDEKGKILNTLKVIGGIERKVDYIQKDVSRVSTFINPIDGKKWLRIVDNPIHAWKYEKDLNMDIIDHYNNITGGVIPDIILTIVQCLKFEEDRRNKIVYIGPAGIGKTVLLKILGFTVFDNAALVQAVKPGKTGISHQKSKELMHTGLLLIDDITEVPSEEKQMTDESVITVKNRGGVLHPTKVIAKTTTDESIFSALGVEWRDRLIVFKAPRVESTLQETEFYNHHGRKVYEKHTTAWIRNMFIEALKEETNQLDALHTKYSLDQVSETGALLDEAMDVLMKEIEAAGIIICDDGRFCIKHKMKIKKMLEDILVDINGGVKTDAKAQANRALEAVLSVRTDVKVNGEINKLYILDYNTAAQTVEMFDDIDQE